MKTDIHKNNNQQCTNHPFALSLSPTSAPTQLKLAELPLFSLDPATPHHTKSLPPRKDSSTATKSPILTKLVSFVQLSHVLPEFGIAIHFQNFDDICFSLAVL
jgi:hypothetical protein